MHRITVELTAADRRSGADDSDMLYVALLETEGSFEYLTDWKREGNWSCWQQHGDHNYYWVP